MTFVKKYWMVFVIIGFCITNFKLLQYEEKTTYTE
mgnify:FL=1